MLPHCYKFFLNCLFYLLQLFGLFLPVEFVDLTLYHYRYWILKQIYAVFVATLIILGYSYLEWLGSQTVYKVRRTSSIVLLVLTYTVVTFICLIAILGTAFWNREKWKHYLKLQRILKSKLKVKRRNSLCFCLEFVLGHLVLFVVAVIRQMRNHIYIEDPFTRFLSVVVSELLLYWIFLITMIIYNSILLLRNHFLAVRKFLTDTLGLEDEVDFTLHKTLEGSIVFPTTTIVGDKTLFGLLETSKILNILFDCMDLFNKIFGLVILLITVSTVLVTLSSLNTLLITGETSELTVEIILDCLFQALIFLVWNSSILSASGLLTEETSEIVKLCCKLQHLLPQGSQERKELLNIAHQVSRKSPKVSASGFFNVDFYLMLSVFTCVGTYTVVLIQFSHMDF